MLQTTPPELPRPTDPVEQPIINSPFHPPDRGRYGVKLA